MHTTRLSLLERLQRPEEQAAWEHFVQLYTPLFFHWAGRLGRQGQDAADLVQDVFLVLVQKLPTFAYDPDKRFRAWLWTILVNKDRQRRRRPAPPGALADAELPEPAIADPADEVAEHEYRTLLVKRALELIQAEFQPATWQAFWECVTTDQSAAAVAAKLGLSLAAVYNAKSRVLRRLRQDLAGLLDGAPPSLGDLR
jgi:RNA polymerase sigma-70 factor (ECF subfamily)